jgi:mannitol/fructose-specific phosphotransferase system IIA component (Ntr-type)
VGIARFSAPELMVPALAAKTRDEAVAELVKQLAEHRFIEDPSGVSDLALHREAIVSTALDHGLAFPHVRNVEGGGLTFALGLKDKGIDFGGTDGHLSKIIFFIVIPTAASAFYLRLLAGLVRTFSETDARKSLLECEKPEQMWKTLTKLTRETIP